MAKVVLTRSAVVSALGPDLESLWQGLLAGRSGVGPVTRFDAGNYISQLGAFISGLEYDSRQTLFAGLLDMLLPQLGAVPPDCRLLLASTKGDVDLLQQQHGQPLAPQLLFENLLANVQKRLGVGDRGININAACASSTVAVARAAAMISAGVCDAVLVVAADVASEFVFSGFSALQAMSPEPARPFDAARKGLNLGEAGVALLLMSEERARKEQEPELAYVSGWGVANDAFHVTAPARDGRGLIKACNQALALAAISPGQIAAINAHATATIFNDAMELVAFNAIFGEELPPLHGVKGSLGHTLGAAGGVELAVAARALSEQMLPGTVGCKQPEEGALGRVSSANQSINGDYLLSCNSGFGGINAVVILHRGDR